MMPESNLILNPYLSLKVFKNEKQMDSFRFLSPIKSRGVQTLDFDGEERPELYQLFSELSQTSLNFLDIEEDLSDAERSLLVDKGVLIQPENVSRQPRFACFLDEIEIKDTVHDTDDLIINKSVYYDDAQDYESMMRRRKYGFEPGLPIVWVTDSKTEITFAYWQRGDFLEIAKNLQPGEKPSRSLSDRQTARLKQAEILVSPDSSNQSNWDNHLVRAAVHFQKEKYTTLRGILPPAQLTALRRYFEELRHEGFMIFNDRQVALRHAIHNDALSIYFHQQLAPLVSRTVGERVKPSYVYSAAYVEDAVLAAHTDRPQCEFTMSMQIAYEPEQRDGVSPWALCLDDLRGNRIETFLANGDAMIYKGCELVHYRDPLFKNHQSTSIFFHFVGENFDGSLD